MELEHLKTVIVGLNEKLKVREDVEQDAVNAREALEVSTQQRTELHVRLEESRRLMFEEAEKNKKFQEIVVAETGQKAHKLTEQLQLTQEAQREIEALRNALALKDRETNELRRQVLEAEELRRQNAQCRRDCGESDQRRQELQLAFERALEDHGRQLEREGRER